MFRLALLALVMQGEPTEYSYINCGPWEYTVDLDNKTWCIGLCVGETIPIQSLDNQRAVLFDWKSPAGEDSATIDLKSLTLRWHLRTGDKDRTLDMPCSGLRRDTERWVK